MSVKNKTNKNYKRSQRGRSMVEMLGVLAIIGVLSVGGVYGYGVAMKKHKANELLHRASMLASTVSAQIMSGKDPTELDTFADSNLGKFTLDYDSTKTTFDLKISELDGSVCSQLKEGGMVQKVECNETAKTASITYYKNLATDPAEGEKSPTGGSGADGDTKPTTCPTGTSTEGAGGYATALADNSMCYCETSGTVYKDGTCESKGDDNTCTSYADCDKGEYCQFSPGSGACTDPTSGTCHSVSGCGLYDIDIGDGKKYTASDYSDCSPDWWTAKDVCASLNMHMPSLSDVGCEGYENVKCPTDDTVYGALKAKGLKWAFWTTDLYEENNPNSCSAWCVNSGEADVVDYVDYGSNSDFLCVR